MKVYRAFQDKRKILEVAGKKVRPRNRKERSEQELTVRPIRVQVTPTSTRRSRRRWSFFVSSKASFGSFFCFEAENLFFFSWRGLDFLAAIRGDRRLDGLIHASSDQSNEMGSDRIGSDQLAWLFLILIHTWIDPGSIQDSDRDCFHFQSGVARKNFDWGLELGSNPGRKVVVHLSRFYLNVVRWRSRLWKSFLRLIVSFISFLFLARNHWNPSAFNNNRHGSLKRLGSTEMPTNSPRSYTHSHTHTRTFTL